MVDGPLMVGESSEWSLFVDALSYISCSSTGGMKAVVCIILSVGQCI